MSKPNKRRIRMDQFKAQITEQVLPDDALIPVELSEDVTVYIKIPILLDEEDDFLERLQACTTQKDVALVILSGGDADPEEQWKQWQLAGYDGVDLVKLFNSERAAAEDRLKAFRYKG